MYDAMATNMLRDWTMMSNLGVAMLLAGAVLVIAVSALANTQQPVRARRR